jgi:hypothetical protein
MFRLLLTALFGLMAATAALAAPPPTFLPPPPPPPMTRAIAPSPLHVWVDGRWTWTGATWIWQPGAWVSPAPRAVVTTWAPPRPVQVTRPVVIVRPPVRPAYVIPVRPTRPVVIVRR